MKLVIVESPTKAKTLSRFLGKDYQILASMGHVRDLPKKKLGVETEKDFKPTYIIVPGKEEAIANLKKAAKKAKEIILATDVDREGEAIAYHVAKILGDKKIKISRITFHEITKSAITQALENPKTINRQLVHAQQARRILDRLVGYKLSPLLWFKIRRGLSAGRVQSPTVRLIVEREKEIKAFKPDEYWYIEAQLTKKESSKQPFKALLIRINDKKAEVKNKKQTQEIVKKLKQSDYQVVGVKKKEVKKSPAPPFITSTLQRSASSLFKWSAKKTMREAQRLYERGLITYHRTDSVSLASEAIKKARIYIDKTFGKEYLPEKPRFFKSKSKLVQEAHEAIRPTRLTKKPEDVAQRLGQATARLYKLILNRFLSCQMEKTVYEKTNVDVQAGIYLLRAAGKVEIFDGWRACYKSTQNLENSKAEDDSLPKLTEGEILKLLKVLSEQKFTQPPSRYTEGSLIKALEEKGIGRPSTYASIIFTIQTRQYVEKIEGHFHPTSVGKTVNDFLVKYFANIVDYDFTAEMEDDLDTIAHGKKKWIKVVSSFYHPFAKKLKKVKKNAKREKIAAEPIGKKCPMCHKGEQVIRVGRFGKFLSCSRFPKCNWKAVYIEKIKGVKCPKCKGAVVIRKTKKGKRFYGCSNWPKCKWATWRKPKSTDNEN